MPLTACTTVSKPRRPRSDMTESAQRETHDAGPQLMQQLGREPAGCQRAGTVALREDIRRADQLAQSFDIAGRAQIELGRELAVPGIRLLIAHMGQMRRGDFENLCAMLGKGPAADRTG